MVIESSFLFCLFPRSFLRSPDASGRRMKGRSPGFFWIPDQVRNDGMDEMSQSNYCITICRIRIGGQRFQCLLRKLPYLFETAEYDQGITGFIDDNFAFAKRCQQQVLELQL
jgi:hypothetical protein